MLSFTPSWFLPNLYNLNLGRKAKSLILCMLDWNKQCRRYRRCGFDCWVRKIPWRRKWQPTQVFSSGKSHGQRSLVGFSPWEHRVITDWAIEHAICDGTWKSNWKCIQIFKIYWNFNGKFNEVRYLLFLLRCLFSHLGKISHPDLLYLFISHLFVFDSLWLGEL